MAKKKSKGQEPVPTTSEQESHESGIISPEKNRILKEHAEKFQEGDPAVRRKNPSRDEIGPKRKAS